MCSEPTNMMTITRSETLQDTIPGRIINLQDSSRIKADTIIFPSSPDSLITISKEKTKDTSVVIKRTPPKQVKLIITDTTSVCGRNSIADITFYDSSNFIKTIGDPPFNKFPFLFTEKNRQAEINAKVSITKHLKSGEDLLRQPLHSDWIIGIILVVSFLYSLIRTASKGLLPGVSRLFQLRGVIDPSIRETEGIFQWQSTIHNLISFLIISLFTYYAASYYAITPFGISGIIMWLLCLFTIIVSVTIRHFICEITGNMSGEKDVFREYLVGIYQSYRFIALFLFVLIILISYTVILPPGTGFIIGSIVIGVIYLIRVTRLIIIFINRNISIFYLILYLCALEILPVLILVKYFSGLI